MLRKAEELTTNFTFFSFSFLNSPSVPCWEQRESPEFCFGDFIWSKKGLKR